MDLSAGRRIMARGNLPPTGGALLSDGMPAMPGGAAPPVFSKVYGKKSNEGFGISLYGLEKEDGAANVRAPSLGHSAKV